MSHCGAQGNGDVTLRCGSGRGGRRGRGACGACGSPDAPGTAPAAASLSATSRSGASMIQNPARYPPTGGRLPLLVFPCGWRAEDASTGVNWSESLAEMDESFPALHKAILGVDIEGFADPRRTNPDQIAMRAGFCIAACGCRRWPGQASPWEACYQEDRGDGALILVPPDIPKALLVIRFPQELSAALRSHNDTDDATSRLRVRLAVHAGKSTRTNTASRVWQRTSPSVCWRQPR